MFAQRQTKNRLLTGSRHQDRVKWNTILICSSPKFKRMFHQTGWHRVGTNRNSPIRHSVTCAIYTTTTQQRNIIDCMLYLYSSNLGSKHVPLLSASSGTSDAWSLVSQLTVPLDKAVHSLTLRSYLCVYLLYGFEDICNIIQSWYFGRKTGNGMDHISAPLETLYCILGQERLCMTAKKERT